LIIGLTLYLRTDNKQILTSVENFTIDNQTFNDLNIFSEKGGSKSIYNLFKHTRTLAARKRLMEIMQTPSNNVDEITLRRDGIKYFHDNQISLEIKNEEVDLIEFYLESQFKEFKNNPLDALADYVTRKSSNDYYVIKTALKYLIQLTRYLLKFIENHKSNQPSKYLNLIFDQIMDIVETGVLLKAIKQSEKSLSFIEVCRLDRALRGAEKENMKTLLKLVYELDVFESIASVASVSGFSFPVFNQEGPFKINITGLFHPSIKNAVKNDVYLDHEQNIIFLSGSNMAGKSSLLKSLGLMNLSLASRLSRACRCNGNHCFQRSGHYH
jgi:DNA mismatch repair protein MutS